MRGSARHKRHRTQKPTAAQEQEFPSEDETGLSRAHYPFPSAEVRALQFLNQQVFTGASALQRISASRYVMRDVAVFLSPLATRH